MSHLTKAAIRDFNANLATLKKAAASNNIVTEVAVIEFGGQNTRVTVPFTPIEQMHPLDSYYVNGNTPMLDGIGMAMNHARSHPYYVHDNASVLIVTTTDGEENASLNYNRTTLSAFMGDQVKTDRWTFAFRAPVRNSIALMLPLFAGNIMCWEQTERGMQEATYRNDVAMTNYMVGRSAGMLSTQDFYQTDLSKVSVKDLKQNARDITTKVRTLTVNSREPIKEFVERSTGETLQKGSVFYQLVKTEKEVQDYKRILVRDRLSKKIFGGDGVRQLLGLNVSGTVKIVPGNHANYDVFVQSNSVNRNLTPNTDLLVWLGN